VVGGARRLDSVLLEETLASIINSRLRHVRGCAWIWATSAAVCTHIWQMGMVPLVRSRRVEHKSKREGARVRRWVVERSHGWLNRYRRLLARQ